MGFQLLYWHHLKSINHPILQLLDASPQSFVGEDVEISLMLLANYASTTNLTRKTQDVSDAYKKLGLLSQIAKKVRDYRISRFGGQTKARSHVTYNESSPEVLATASFVRRWIDRTEEKGLLTYKLEGKRQLIAKKTTAIKKAKTYKNVPSIDFHWQPFATSMIQRHLEALTNNAHKVSDDFDRQFMEQFADLYSFDDEAMNRFQEDPASDSSIDELPLGSEEWKSRMENPDIVDYSEEAMMKEQKMKEQRREERKVAAAQAAQPAKRPRGRPRKKPQPILPPQASAPPPKRGRGRPKGSRNKKSLALLSQETKSQTAVPASIPTSPNVAAVDQNDRFACF